MLSWLTLKRFPCLGPRRQLPFGFSVYLNVYDMYWTNDYTFNIGIGVYHTGVEIHDYEYAYGGHPFPFSGIFPIHPKDAQELGQHFKFKESVFVGYTDFTPDDVNMIIEQMGKEYTGDKYHLINKNCNHFSNAFVETLCGKSIPGWVNRLAYLSSCIPFLEKSLPPDWLTPVALEEALGRSSSHEISSPSSNLSSIDLAHNFDRTKLSTLSLDQKGCQIDTPNMVPTQDLLSSSQPNLSLTSNVQLTNEPSSPSYSADVKTLYDESIASNSTLETSNSPKKTPTQPPLPPKNFLTSILNIFKEDTITPHVSPRSSEPPKTNGKLSSSSSPSIVNYLQSH